MEIGHLLDGQAILTQSTRDDWAHEHEADDGWVRKVFCGNHRVLHEGARTYVAFRQTHTDGLSRSLWTRSTTWLVTLIDGRVVEAYSIGYESGDNSYRRDRGLRCFATRT